MDNSPICKCGKKMESIGGNPVFTWYACSEGCGHTKRIDIGDVDTLIDETHRAIMERD